MFVRNFCIVPPDSFFLLWFLSFLPPRVEIYDKILSFANRVGLTVTFNRELNCLVVVELKRGEFKPAYLGQLSAYLRIIDDKVRKPHENRTIGIVLCKSMNKEFAEYVIQDYDKPMGVTTYKSISEMPKKMQNVLPDLDEMKKLM